MESIRSSDRGSNWEYDPDDIDFPVPAQAAVTTAASGSTGSTTIQRVRISAISDLKEFSGRDPDEDRTRAWISKVKPDESPLDYLYRLNVAGLRAQLKIKDGSTKNRREHVDHFTETLEDRLTLLRLSDADDLEEVLCARDRAKSRQKKAAVESGKFRQKASNAAPSAPAKQVRAIQIQAADSRSDTSDGSDGSDSEMDNHCRIYLAANQEVAPKEESETIIPDPGHQDPGSMNHIHQEHRSKIQGDGFNRNRRSHCGSKKHSNLGCWRRVTCINLRQADEYARSDVTMTVDLHPGESRGYWKQKDPYLWFKPADQETTTEITKPTPGKWFRQAKIVGKIHNEKAILLLDTGAEVSIVDTAFARKAGCYIDSSQIQDWDLSGQEAILGLDFMVPAGIRLNLAHGSISLPDEVRIQLSGRRQLYSDKTRIVNLGQYLRIQPGESVELPLRLRKIRYVKITNVGDKVVILHQDLRIGISLAGDPVPRLPGFISVGSRRYMEWQNLALEATVDSRSAGPDPEAEDPPMPAVEHPEYETPRDILQRPRPTAIKCLKGGSSGDQEVSDHPPSDNPPSDNPPLDYDDSMSHVVTVVKALEDQDPGVSGITAVDLALVEDPAVETALADEALSDVTGANQDPPVQEVQDLKVATLKGDRSHPPSSMGVESMTSHKLGDPLDQKDATSMSQKKDEDPAAVPEDQPDTSDLDLTWDSDQDYDECVYYHHEGSDLYAEDVDGQLAVLPEVPVTTEDVKIEDIQLCGSDNQTPEEIDRLRQRISKFRARPIALKCRKLRIQFREKLAELIKGLLSAKMINHSRSPWASPIAVIIKKNGVDIRLCINYRLVNSLTQLMMTDQARLLSAFITPFGLFEWNRMPFGLKNAPQIYQRMIDNALYGFTRIPKMAGDLERLDVFEAGEHLLEACDKWNLSISVVNSFWGMPKVEYLGHKVLEANPKDLSALTDLEFPGSLRAMQSFLGSLNYYSRFIEDYAIYASVLYELREIDYAAMEKDMNRSRIQLALASESPDLDMLTTDPTSPQPSDPDPQGPDLELSKQDPNLVSRDPMPDCVKVSNPERDNLADLDPRWIHAHRSFKVLKEKIAKTPILRHFDPDQQAVVVVYASDWAISGAVMQEYDQIYYPVMFASRTLKSNELNNGVAEKEVSYKGNTELLIFEDLFSEYVIAKASGSTTAQTVAESYEECVFRRFGASEVIRHDREPGFMSDFFRAFNKILDQRQCATMAYRPQANGYAERMVQTTTRALKMNVQDLDQRDWDEYAERLTFAINTARDRIRGETPFYMVHGWDPRSTLEAMIPMGSTRRQDRDPRRWRYRIQSHYQQAREQVNQRLREAISDRADQHTDIVRPHQVEAGSRVWLYLDRVREGYAKNLAHRWHGPFRMSEKIVEYAVKLEIAGSAYTIFPVVYVSKIKPVREFPDRPVTRLTTQDQDRLDFDEVLLPGDRWSQDRDPDEYEVERISDMRTGKRTRYGRILREFLVHWRGYEDPTWIDEADLNYGAILHEFLRDRANQNRFGVMQSHEEA
ncbi:reverse transcriptase [Phytophthora megakarya]|uniref:Reverse transcriptase n=1 Tax=Phytophthora megakarya TaxID=4795 RepID=A0A225W2I5_9STRA|nr:reverse transcriptase [Phytophthora megakarya]